MEYGKIVNNEIEYFVPYKGGLLLNGYIIINPLESQYNEAGWYRVENIEEDGELVQYGNVIKNYIGQSEIDDPLEIAKRDKIAEIEEFDVSSSVNEFFYNGLPLWIPRETRVSLQNSTAILLKNGIETATLWQDNINFRLPCEALLQLLDAIEIYALQCFNKTAEHKANVISMTSIEDVESYDYTEGYPEKLHLNL